MCVWKRVYIDHMIDSGTMGTSGMFPFFSASSKEENKQAQAEDKWISISLFDIIMFAIPR